ncbi:MAG: transposase [Sulfurimonas sp.]|nr:transposase [Sulfurimonas sp.]
MGYDFITSIGKSSIQALIDNKESKIEMSLFDENLKEIIENNTRYILRQNPLRRDEIRETRESKQERLKGFIKEKTDYYNTHYRAKSTTLQKHIDKKISDLKLNKFVTVTISYKEGNVKRINKNQEEVLKTKEIATTTIEIDKKEKTKIEQLDGCYVVTSSLIDTSKDSKEDIHKAYKTLIKVENAFKTLKTEFLEIRPLYLKTDERIQGHIALSMHAYNITLKLKGFTKESELDFKSTIRELSTVKTVVNRINQAIKFETIPTVSDTLKTLFTNMKLKFPTKI